MQLPTSLQNAIEQATQSLGLSKLIEAREELTQKYRQSISGLPFMTTDAQRQSYVISRMPATFASLHASMQAILERGEFSIKSLLDLGAGPGTGMWAASDSFLDIEKISLVEKDVALISLGKQLAKNSDQEVLQKAHWQEGDLEKVDHLPSHDLVLLSYSIGEIQPEKVLPLLDLCWNATDKLLLIVEPGTPVGFERIRMIRHHLIGKGAHLLAPCPHENICPMANGDWCHFAARVERTSLHRKLKGGSLGYEDEKFSYIAATRQPFSLASTRILRQPSRHSGHSVFTLCTPEGVQQRTISKKMGELYKEARKKDWGDSL